MCSLSVCIQGDVKSFTIFRNYTVCDTSAVTGFKSAQFSKT